MIVPYILHSLYSSNPQVIVPTLRTTFPPQHVWLQQTSTNVAQKQKQKQQQKELPPPLLLVEE